MDVPYDATDDIVVLPTHGVVPGSGVVPTNAFLMRGRDPVLVDTGPPVDRREFLAALSRLVDPAEVSWVFLTQEERDHSGNLGDVLRYAPAAKVVTTFAALPTLSMDVGVPLERLRLVVPGELFTANGRTWRVVRPPVFHAPSTVGFFDREEANLFSSDCFGALLPQPVESGDDVSRDQLAQGMAQFARASAGWLSLADPDRFEAAVECIRELAPVTILSSHGPVLRDLAAWACDQLAMLPGADFPWVDDLDFRRMVDEERRRRPAA